MLRSTFLYVILPHLIFFFEDWKYIFQNNLPKLFLIRMF